MSKRIYKLGNWPSEYEENKLKENLSRPLQVDERLRIGAVYTGERRMPKSGEWFLSGAIITAYKAPTDLSEPYYIAKLVAYVEVIRKKILGEL